jgi:hypothetical protein
MEYSIMAYTRTPNSVIAGVGLLQTPNPVPLTPSGILPVILDAKIASTTSLGVVQIGNNIQITPEGVISVKDSHNCKRATKVISENYTASESDYYIGVDSTKAVVITLPSTPHAGTELIIKVEMKPPVGSRKVTIKTSDGSLIDGSSSVVLQQSYEFIRVLYRSNWFRV